MPRKEINMGAEVVSTIGSGLGVIEDLASEFLKGFETLIWVPAEGQVAGHLTTVGVFAFVMLGISVSFAVIKLCLNLLRGNTGV